MSAATLIAEIGDDMSKNPKREQDDQNDLVRGGWCCHQDQEAVQGQVSVVIRRGHKRSLVAIAHKLIRVIYTLLKRRQPYIDPDTDYEGLMVRRNAARWLNKLVDYGYLALAQQ